MAYIEDFFAFFGKSFFYVADLFKGLGAFVLFHIRLFPLYFKPPYRIRETMQQIVIVGVGSIGVIALTGTFTGLVEAVQLYQGFHKFGAENMMGYTIFISITKELGPVFAGLMLTSRAISAMAAELGTMRVTEQIDALETLAVNSKNYLIVPRIIATTISLPLLVAIFDFAGNLSAYLISTKALGVNETEYVNTIHMYLSYSEIYSGLLKGAVFGFTIGSIGTYIGYFTSGGARGVGESTTMAVVYSAMMVFVLDYFLSSLFLVLDW
ncbi:MAG: ABC transporter permease [Campylobacteraceae bacterium 4484_4]|nr:MAG: ABC transporter permease [Campylobacteraceae bacterium 4484_4]